MGRTTDRLEWIALAWHAKVGPAAFHKLLARFGAPRTAAEAGEDRRAAGLRVPARLEHQRAGALAVDHPVAIGIEGPHGAGRIVDALGQMVGAAIGPNGRVDTAAGSPGDHDVGLAALEDAGRFGQGWRPRRRWIAVTTTPFAA